MSRDQTFIQTQRFVTFCRLEKSSSEKKAGAKETIPGEKGRVTAVFCLETPGICRFSLFLKQQPFLGYTFCSTTCVKNHAYSVYILSQLAYVAYNTRRQLLVFYFDQCRRGVLIYPNCFVLLLFYHIQ